MMQYFTSPVDGTFSHYHLCRILVWMILLLSTIGELLGFKKIVAIVISTFQAMSSQTK